MNELARDENPYWHSQGQTHSIDLDLLRRMCFDIYNIFTASAALAGQFEFSDEGEEPENTSLLKLHHELAEPRALETLLQLCMLVRTYDDVMSQSDHAKEYAAHAENTSGDDYIGVLDIGKFSLREACNKVIHAQEVRPIYDSADRDTEVGGRTERVWHLDGEIELAGTLNNKEWNAVLYVQPFLEIVLDRISFGWGD